VNLLLGLLFVAVGPLMSAPLAQADALAGSNWTNDTYYRLMSIGCCTTSGLTQGCLPPPSHWAAGKSRTANCEGILSDITCPRAR